MQTWLEATITENLRIFNYLFQNQASKIHSFTLTVIVHSDEQLNIYIYAPSNMSYKNTPLGLGNNEQTKNRGKGQSASQTDTAASNTIALVYPDGRVTNVEVRQK